VVRQAEALEERDDPRPVRRLVRPAREEIRLRAWAERVTNAVTAWIRSPRSVSTSGAKGR
jgi:hypothetical protein